MGSFTCRGLVEADARRGGCPREEPGLSTPQRVGAATPGGQA